MKLLCVYECNLLNLKIATLYSVSHGVYVKVTFSCFGKSRNPIEHGRLVAGGLVGLAGSHNLAVGYGGLGTYQE